MKDKRLIKNILLALFVCVFACTELAQSAAPSKKCGTCGQPIAKCQYKGKHPAKSQPTSKPQAQTSKPKSQLQNKVSATVSKPTGYENGHEYVDLGLSVKWATCNVGASKPSETGDFFAWGEIKPKVNYSWDNYFDCLECTNNRKIFGLYKTGGETTISPTSGHDTARENWGGSWRMPTIEELEELNSKCKWIWTSIDGRKGRKIVGPNGNSIFLPVGVLIDPANKYSERECCYLWSNTLGTNPIYAKYLYFNDLAHNTNEYKTRYDGLCVRPVTE